MKNFYKNILLLCAVLFLSYFTSSHFGALYDLFTPLYDSSFSPVPKEGLLILAGAPFAYIFFLTLLFQLFGWGNRNKWTGWLLAPTLLFFAAGDLRHIYLPIALVLIAFGLVKLIRKLFRI